MSGTFANALLAGWNQSPLGDGLTPQEQQVNRLFQTIMSNPVGTETVSPLLTNPTPGVQPVAFWGGRPVSQNFRDMVDLGTGISMGLVGSTNLPSGIRAYHGSPHSFDKFSSDYIGTTTGEAAFSRGHNFADEKTAKVYRDTLAPTGHMYEVNIKADPEHFLDWDKPLSEQSPFVQKALQDAGITKGTLDADPTGADLHTMLKGGIGMVDKEGGLFYPGGKAKRDDVQTVRMLRDAGIPGMRHHGDSYVVYDDSIIDILRKYGIAGLIAGGGAAAGTQGQ